ncbi:HTH-type transcriptional regulator BhcR [Pelagibius sp. Alg239-R121]|uniref:HTH-type transcriptional regulator BhcR n=1 Tax=Pelagibius sp. Alg239-R121 TaxID=2993448 RepID=UPI0024A764F1|nr:HTH-type transcriptional regulator BhcR [Pelagibius sp. Alg239-R121]
MAKATPLSRPRGRPPSGKTTQTSSVQALDRALGLLELLADEEGLTLSELAQRADMAPSTTHRLLSTLQGRHFVDLDEETSQWQIGVKTFQIGSTFARHRKLVTMGRGIMRALMETCEETVNLAIEDEGDVVFISQFESHSPMRAFFRPGHRGAIHASGIGKALMATWEEGAVRKLVRKKQLVGFTDKTHRDAGSLLADLERIRDRGWSVDDEEHTLGMRCIAAPIFNEYGEAIAGVSVSGPTIRIPDDRVDRIGPEVQHAADRITDSIGGIRP